jgi:hypothetical protein
MNKLYLSAASLVSLVVLATSSSVAMAKGGEENPASVLIDQSGNTVKIDQSGNNNNVDANITNDSSNPVPVTVQGGTQTIVEYRYVGLTSADPTSGRVTALGNSNTSLIGFAAMNKLCAEDYGPAARAATINEAFFRNDLDISDAWVVADGVDVYAIEFTVEGVPKKWAAVASSNGVSLGLPVGNPYSAIRFSQCGQYTTDGLSMQGSITRQHGQIGVATCDTILPVACSAPTVFMLP